MKKVFFRCNILVLHIYYCFLLEKQIFKIVNGDVHGTSTGPSSGTSSGPNDGTFWGRPQDVGHICFKIQLRNILSLPWQVSQDFIVKCGSETFSEQYSNLNNKN